MVRKFVTLGGDHLDVEREPPHVAEAHAAEGRPSAREQVLVYGVDEEPVGRAGQVGLRAGRLAAAVAGGERLRPRAEARCEIWGASRGRWATR